MRLLLFLLLSFALSRYAKGEGCRMNAHPDSTASISEPSQLNYDFDLVASPMINFNYHMGNYGLYGQNLVFQHVVYQGVTVLRLDGWKYRGGFNSPGVLDSISHTNVLFEKSFSGEEYISVKHIQRLSNNIDINGAFEKNGSDGQYSGSVEGQKALNTFAAFNINYTSLNNRFDSKLYFEMYDYKYNENGGLDTLINYLDSVLNYENEDYNLTSANAHNKVISVSHVSTLRVDSARNWDISLTNGFRNERFSYGDVNPNSAYYATVFGSDTLKSFVDTSFLKAYSTSVSVGKKMKANGGYLSVSNELSYFEYFQNSERLIGNNGFLNVSYLSSLKVLNAINLAGHFYYLGYNKDDFNLTVSQTRRSGLESNFREKSIIKVFIEDVSPTLWQQAYSSDFLSYTNGFGATRNYGFSYRYFGDKVSALRSNLEYGLSVTGLFNYVYLNDQFQFQQKNDNAFKVMSMDVSKLFRINKWNLNVKGLYQVASKDAPIAIPDMACVLRLYREQALFKGAMQTRIGVDLSYAKSFYGYGFHPVLRNVVLQTERLTGGYPFLDGYFTATINKARLFFRTTHLNEGYSGNNYFYFAKYPMAGRAYKIGVMWHFDN